MLTKISTETETIVASVIVIIIIVNNCLTKAA